jgi:hypothetical protein
MYRKSIVLSALFAAVASLGYGEKRPPPGRAALRTWSTAPEPATLVQTGAFGAAAQAMGAFAGRKLSPVRIRATDYSLEYARRNLLPLMGGSVAIGDINGDGRPDVYVVLPGGSNRLFRGEVDGRFTDVTEAARVAGKGTSLSATFADYDHSGRLSLFVSGLDGITVFRNNGDGTFVDETEKAGLQRRPGELYTSISAADVNQDGFPDLLATVYTNLNNPPQKSAFLFPNDFTGAQSRLYLNDRAKFTDATAAAGLSGNPGRGRNALFADFNRDGRPDLLILRDDKPPAFYLSSGSGKFRDATWKAGEHVSRNAFVEGCTADLNHDGSLDLILWSTMGNRILLNLGDGRFERAEGQPVIPPPENPFGFRGLVADLNGDGFEDVLALDNDGKCHYFANRSGYFREADVLVKPGQQSLATSTAVIPMRVKGAHALCLLALQSDGRVLVLALQ